MGARPVLGLVSLLLIAGGIVFQFLVILSGAVAGGPINQIYFLQTTTNGISPQPRNPSRWTFFSICGVGDNGLNANCGAIVPALPFDPPRGNNFGTTNGIPDGLVGTHRFYYLSRFMFAFYIIALFFAVCALFTGLLALCTRLGAYLSGLNAAMALFFQALAASLMTAWTIQGRNRFRSAGQSASIGIKAYAFTWSALACFLLATIMFCLGGRSKDKTYTSDRNRGGMFGRKKSMRSRGSFVGSERGGVKDDYS
ncbi:SUR7-domain-containing protein [Tothia fuscella]|uniref:SUR7-domain-containing protein n=1 Tax=Tothia fuscella TaxID=1048955 RepID=A0A9P4TZY6_9PEZI|nr:SUR7-domain-containing protein [Tothia fuscella]